jgi:multidrug resistance efflux pump
MKANSEVAASPTTGSGRRAGEGKLKRLFILILSLGIIGLAIFLSLRAWDYNEQHPRTDDAVSRANIIGIAPRISGQIIKINVSDNQFVKNGDLLFEIDPADFQLAVDRAESARAALDQQIEVGKSQDAQIKFQAAAAEAAVRQATAERDQAADTLRVEVKGLPFVKRDLNWVRIAQRFPVRIEIENPDPNIFRMGTTAVTTILGFIPPEGAK